MTELTIKEIEDLCKKYDLLFKNISLLCDCDKSEYRLFIRGNGFFESKCWSRYLMNKGSWNTIASFYIKDKESFIVSSIGTKLHKQDTNDFFVVTNFCECYYNKSEFIKWLDRFVKKIRIKMKKYFTEKKLKELEGDFE